MEEFKYKKNSLQFFKLKGEILDSERLCKTQVSSCMRSAKLGHKEADIAAPTTTSTSARHHQFWVRTEDGNEHDVKFKSINIPLRAGQIITLIYAGKAGQKSGAYVTLINHNAKEHWWLNHADQLNQHFQLEAISGKSLLIGLALGLATFGITSSFLASAVATAGFLGYRAFVKLSRIKKLERSLDQHLSQVVLNAY